MSDHYLTVNDFLAYDKQLMGKLGRIGDNVAAIKEQVRHLNATFTAYHAETDAFRIQTRQDFAQVNQQLATIEHSLTQGFAALFVHLGIQQQRPSRPLTCAVGGRFAAILVCLCMVLY